MEKRVTPLAKGNNIFENQLIYFGTKHGKGEVLSPLFSQLGAHCEAVEIDTDRFGTFSGEVDRRGSVRETLRRKIQGTYAARPQGRFFLASEGSFGGDPFTGVLRIDLESLLLWDRKANQEIYAEHLCRRPMDVERALGPCDDFREFLRSIEFPDHAVMVRPRKSPTPLFKGLQTEQAVAQAMLQCFWESRSSKVILSTDLRAHLNKRRREAIFQAGQRLIAKLLSLCPNCGAPGYGIAEEIPGLPCEDCGEPSAAALAVRFECFQCHQSEERPRPDGKISIPPEDCEYCNH